MFVVPNSFFKEDQFVLLSYIHYFVPYEMYSKGWIYCVDKRIGEDDRGMITSSDYITKTEAGSILSSWGLKYQ